MMKKTILAISLMSIMSLGANAETTKKLTFYKDLSQYKESKTVNLEPNKPLLVNLTDTAVLDTFNVSLMKEGKLITPRSVETHPKSEENIFKLNKGETIFINNVKYTLIENGKGFIKVKTENNLITFIPKNKIEIISFTNDVDATSHIVQVKSNSPVQDVDLSYSYVLGEMSWGPKYDLYIKDKNNIELDYNIEIKNETLTSFEDLSVVFMLDDINRIYKEYTTDTNGGLFDYNQYLVILKDGSTTYKRVYDSEGYDQVGYNKVGYNRSGVSNSNFYQINEVLSELNNGRRSFSFSEKVSIPAKARTLYPYKNALLMPYEKENNIYLTNRVEEGQVFIPQSNLLIENKDEIQLSKGVVRIFNSQKGLNSDVVGEEHLRENKGSEKIKINIGDNYGVKIKVEDVDIVNEGKIIVSKTKNFVRSNVRTVPYSVSKIKINIDNVGKEKILSFKNNNIILEKDKSKLDSLIGLNIVDEMDILEYQKVNKKINDLRQKDYEIDLSKVSELTFYVYEG